MLKSPALLPNSTPPNPSLLPNDVDTVLRSITKDSEALLTLPRPAKMLVSYGPLLPPLNPAEAAMVCQTKEAPSDPSPYVSQKYMS